MTQAETTRATITGFVSAIYSTQAADWYTQTQERQAIAEALASYILATYEHKEA